MDVYYNSAGLEVIRGLVGFPFSISLKRVRCSVAGPVSCSPPIPVSPKKLEGTWLDLASYGSCIESINHVFLQGSKEKMKEHEKTAVGAHMLLLLQHIKQLKASLCTVSKAANGFVPQSQLNVNVADKSIPDLQIPGSLEINGDLEVDCFPASVPEDESVLQQLVREKVISELENKLHVFENIVSVLNKEVETSNLEITAFRRQSELDQNIIRGLELKVNIYDKHCLCACCIDDTLNTCQRETM